jgi:hypothetical protein
VRWVIRHVVPRVTLSARCIRYWEADVLAFADRLVDARLRGRNAWREIGLGDFLERQEAVAILAVVDEAGFQRRLDPGHHRLVDIALALFAPFNFDFVVEEFLSVDNCQAAFFGLRGVNKHPFHGLRPSSVLHALKGL